MALPFPPLSNRKIFLLYTCYFNFFIIVQNKSLLIGNTNGFCNFYHLIQRDRIPSQLFPKILRLLANKPSQF